MKRMLTILLTALLILSCTSFAWAESTLDDVKAYFDESNSSIVASGVSPFGEGHIVSAKIMLGDEMIYFNFGEAGKNGKFEFKCSLNPLTDATGLYNITLGGAGISAITVEEPVIFVNKADTDRIISVINDSTKETIEANIIADNTYIDVDLSGDIAQLSKPEEVFNQLVEDDFATIPELRKAFDIAVAIQTFNEADASDGLELLEKYEDTLGLDLSDLFADIKTDVLKTDVYEEICGGKIKLTEEKFDECFNKAVYTALFNGLDSSDRESLIPYIEACNEAGYTDIDLEEYEDLESAEQVNIIKDVIEAKNSNKFNDLSEVGSVFAETIDELLEEKEKENKKDDSPKRGGGGGGIKLQAPSDKVAYENQEPTLPEVKKFNDLGDVKWAETQIEYLASKGIINGRDDGIYDPNGNITREEFVKILVSGLDLPNEVTQNSFVDVTEDKWFYEPVMKAYALGIINGVDFDVFGAGKHITREQLCAIVYRAVLLLDAEIQVEDIDVEIADKDSVSEYAVPAVESMYRAGIVSGMGDGSFNPKGFATRAQTAKIIYEVLERIGRL